MVMDLPEELELPLRSGAEWWYWLGGRPAIDFINTQRERWRRNVETLVTPQDLVLWLQKARLLEGAVPITHAHLRGARRLRAAIDACIVAAIEDVALPREAADEVNRWLRHARLPHRLEVSGAGVALTAAPPPDPARYALAQIAADAALLLGTEQRSRLRVCASATCSARFYDASRAGTRRWCSMAGCGNAAKARRHRRKQG
jgi:predicted RNA-binding Zn ribbon-like protein